MLELRALKEVVANRFHSKVLTMQANRHFRAPNAKEMMVEGGMACPELHEDCGLPAAKGVYKS